MREELLALVSRRGTLLEPAAVEYLLTQEDPMVPLDRFLASCGEVPFVVTLRDVVQAAEIGRLAASHGRPVVLARREVAVSRALPTAIELRAPPPASFRREGEVAADHADPSQ